MEAKKFGLAIVVIVAIVIGAAVFLWLGSSSSVANTGGNATATTTTTTAPAPQTITVTGSTTVLPIAQAAAEAYMSLHPNANIQVSGGGSSVGIQAVGSGTADIGDASRELNSSEVSQYPNLVKTVIADDGITLIVYPTNSVSSLTLEQMRGIYNGTYTNWDQVGGSDQTIVVVGRESTSGTRQSFQDMVMHGDNFVSTMLEFNSNGGVQQDVSQTPGAIGYVGLGYVNQSVKALKINENGQLIEPLVANVLNGSYPLSRTLNMFTKGEPTGLAKDFIDFILSPTGQQIVENEGFVPLS